MPLVDGEAGVSKGDRELAKGAGAKEGVKDGRGAELSESVGRELTSMVFK